MKHNIKWKKAENLGNWFKGEVTSKAVLNQIPTEVEDYCPAWLIAKIGDAINKAYLKTSESDLEYIGNLEADLRELKEQKSLANNNIVLP